MPPEHYFTSPTKAPSKIKKIFASVANQSMSLQTAPSVFSPDGIDKGSRILLENIIFLPIDRTEKILELGSGYGPIVIWLNKKYDLEHQINFDHPPIPEIYASEVNERAVWLLKRNLISNDCKKVHVLKGDFQDQNSWLETENIKFDVIYTNPPLKVGHEKLLQLFDLMMNHLAPHGFIQYVHKKKLGAPGLLKKIMDRHPTWQSGIYKKSAGYHVIVLAPEKLPYEPPSSRSSGYF